ncbi:hypothetical protein [Porphyromonas pogonae]|nr:hypothetical protein [Porphyromonas pogonae]
MRYNTLQQHTDYSLFLNEYAVCGVPYNSQSIIAHFTPHLSQYIQ